MGAIQKIDKKERCSAVIDTEIYRINVYCDVRKATLFSMNI